MVQVIKRIGKGGLYTSFIIKKTLLYKLIKNIIGGDNKECQDKINNDIDNPLSPAWLQIHKILQNIPGKSIATILGKIESKEIVIKAQLNINAQSEYSIQQQLQNIPGFINYICLFQCAGDREYIERFAYYGDETRMCKMKGTDIGIIIMPYYKNGSLEEFLKNYKGIDKNSLIKQLLISIIKNLFVAYKQVGFTHGDLYPKNIVLNDTFDPIIIDFEKSTFNNQNKAYIFWHDIDDLLIDTSRYVYSCDVTELCRNILFYRAYNKDPNDENITSIINEISQFKK